MFSSTPQSVKIVVSGFSPLVTSSFESSLAMRLLSFGIGRNWVLTVIYLHSIPHSRFPDTASDMLVLPESEVFSQQCFLLGKKVQWDAPAVAKLSLAHSSWFSARCADDPMSWPR